ncbi:uncharacterized protein LOC112903382 isoform X1 [Panicum hallii]|uniref:uncharacterized protein LOC112903382 isoform X1 n=1 Tax=Panicum hallii TaxID=206008 RepID=UPI000DF4D060|nr:uncharacterized protein LOC112903382 isoform X1 [Panicum hallii]
MEGTAGSIPKFGEWKANDGGSPYTMYFENARKRRSNSGIAPPPGASPARIISAPAGPRTPPRAPDAKPVKPEDRANRSRNQAKAGQGGSGSVPTWGEWNESNSSAGAQQYTLVFNQLREERRSAPPTPSIEHVQRPTPTRATHHDLYDHAPKPRDTTLLKTIFHYRASNAAGCFEYLRDYGCYTRS